MQCNAQRGYSWQGRAAFGISWTLNTFLNAHLHWASVRGLHWSIYMCRRICTHAGKRPILNHLLACVPAGVEACESQRLGEHWGPGRPYESRDQDTSLRVSLWRPPSSLLPAVSVAQGVGRPPTCCVSAAACVHMDLLIQSNELRLSLSLWLFCLQLKPAIFCHILYYMQRNLPAHVCFNNSVWPNLLKCLMILMFWVKLTLERFNSLSYKWKSPIIQ